MGQTSRAVKEATRVWSSYFYDSDPFSYRLSNIWSKVMGDEQIDFDNTYRINPRILGMLCEDSLGVSIMVNASATKPQQWFTAAHELGHFYLHKNERDAFIDDLTRFENYEQESPEENEATEFAAEITLPTDLLIKMLRLRPDFFDIPYSTGAPVWCVEWRLARLISALINVRQDVAMELVTDYRACSKQRKWNDILLFRRIDDYCNFELPSLRDSLILT